MTAAEDERPRPGRGGRRGAGGVRARLVRGVGGSLAVQIAGRGLSLALMVVLARAMGAGPFGEFVYAFAFLGLAELLALLGFDRVLVRFISAYRTKAEWGLLRGVMRQADRIPLAAAVALGAAGAVVVWLLRARLSADLALTFWIACALLPIVVLGTVRRAALRGFLVVVPSQIPGTILRPLLLGTAAAALAYAFGVTLTAPMVMGLLAGVAALNLVILSVMRRRALPPQVREVPGTTQTRAWLAVAMPLLLISGMTIVMTRTDTIMVGALIDAKSAGIYNAATRFARLSMLGLVAIRFMAGPMISSLYADGEHRRLQRMLTAAGWGSLALTVPVCAVLFLWGRELLSLFGPEFVAADAALRFLAVGQVVAALAGPIGILLTMTGRERPAAWTLVGAAMLNIVLNALLIPAWGIEGAAIATLVSTVVWKATLTVVAWRRTGLSATVLWPGRHR